MYSINYFELKFTWLGDRSVCDVTDDVILYKETVASQILTKEVRKGNYYRLSIDIDSL